MQDFSQWMTALQQQSAVASSYAETDCADSDSDDGDDCQCGRRDTKRKLVSQDAQRVWARTAPIRIPASNGRRQQQPPQSVAESADMSYHADMRLLRAGRYLHHHDGDDLDEDEPALYGNLAFFRSQCGASQTRMAPQSAAFKDFTAAPASPTGVDGRDDEDIFAMEL
jgi:hypothetical protein